MTYRDIRIEAVETPHARIGHSSYLVTWHGLRLYFTGDTDSTERLLAMKNLDAAFVSPWLLEAVAEQKARIDAKQVVVYHQTADRDRPRLPEAPPPEAGGDLHPPGRQRRRRPSLRPETAGFDRRYSSISLRRVSGRGCEARNSGGR